MSSELNAATRACIDHIQEPFPSKYIDQAKLLNRRLLTCLDSLPNRTRAGIAVAISLLLHCFIVALMLLHPKGGFAAIGSTGVGQSDGAGTSIALVQPVFLTSSTPSTLSAPDVIMIKQFAQSATPANDASKRFEKASIDGVMSKTLAETAISDDGKSLPKAGGAPDSAGALGQQGQELDALWSAIAPCWNKLVDENTTSAVLRVTFSPSGALAVPPEIERNAETPITPQSLQSEAKAIAALAECGAYPMAQGRQDVVITFPRPK